MMLTLHCSLLLIFMQMFQLRRVSIKLPRCRVVSCIEIILGRVVCVCEVAARVSPPSCPSHPDKSEEMTHPATSLNTELID